MLGRDYGDQGARWRMFALVLGAVFTVGIMAISAQHWIQRQGEGMARYRDWMVSGHPCQTPRRASFDPQDGQGPQVTSFGGARFARAHGAMRCGEVVDDRGRGDTLFAVCQFDHPGTLEVSTRRGLFWFRAGYVSPATIAVRRGIPSCVVGASQDFGHRLIFDAPGPPDRQRRP